MSHSFAIQGPGPEPTLEELTAGAASANDCAPRGEGRVAALYRQHASVIQRHCRRLLNDVDAAADVTQETFIRASRHAERLPPGREALAWLYRVATNLCLNDMRDRRTARAATAAFGETLAATVAGPEGAVADRELVRQLLAALPEKVRMAAVLRHVDGLHDAEVAAALGVGRRTVVYRLAAFKQRTARRVAAVT